MPQLGGGKRHALVEIRRAGQVGELGDGLVAGG